MQAAYASADDSNGGFVTMNMIVHYPKYFAAAYPVCEATLNDALTDENGRIYQRYADLVQHMQRMT